MIDGTVDGEGGVAVDLYNAAGRRLGNSKVVSNHFTVFWTPVGYASAADVPPSVPGGKLRLLAEDGRVLDERAIDLTAQLIPACG